MKSFKISAGLSVSLLGFVLLIAFLLVAGPISVSAQDRYAIDRSQTRVREQIIREQGAGSATVSFPQDMPAVSYPITEAQTGVRGRGVYIRDNYSQPQIFSYEATVNNRSGRVERVFYQFENANNPGNVPSWLVGTFTGRSPLNGQRMTLTVLPSGEASVIYENGGRERGIAFANGIRFGSLNWDLTQMDNGFRARAGGRSERFDLSPVVVDGRPDQCDVPRWLRGRFRGVTDSGESELTINADGSATARSLRGNRSFNGRYADGILTFEFGSFGISREGNGIRTINVNNSSNQTTYSRVGFIN